MKKVNRLKLNLNKDERKYIFTYTLWKCHTKYKKSIGSFDAYFYSSLMNNLFKENDKIKPTYQLFDISYEKIDLTFDALNENEEKLIKGKYFYNYTLKELAKMYNCSHELIRQRLKIAIQKLRKDYTNGV